MKKSIAVVSHSSYAQSKKNNFARMPIYECTCGKRILVVPDVSAMNVALRRHMIEHKRKTGELLTERKIVEEIFKILSKRSQPFAAKGRPCLP